MALQDCIIAEEELDIKIRGDSFIMILPIPPLLLDPQTRVESYILGKRVFPTAVQEWVRRIERYSDSLPEGEKRTFLTDRYLSVPLEVTEELGRFNIGPSVFFEGSVIAHGNSLACCSIGRNIGGSIYFDAQNPTSFPYPNHCVKFSPEKLKAYEPPEDPGRVFTYRTHNVDQPEFALFHLSWARQYVNAALESLLKST